MTSSVARQPPISTLRVTDPMFEAYIQDDLSIGRKVRADNLASTCGEWQLDARQQLRPFGGHTDDPATLNIGWNQTTSAGGNGAFSQATGVFDAPEGSFTAHLNQLKDRIWGHSWSGDRRINMGNGADIDATTVNIGVGSGATGTVAFVDNFSGSFQADTVNFNAGLFDFGTTTR